MSEGQWSIETDPDALRLIKAIIDDTDVQKTKMSAQVTEQKKKLLCMEYAHCSGVPYGDNNADRCHDRIREIEAGLRRLSEKRRYFEAMLRRYECRHHEE